MKVLFVSSGKENGVPGTIVHAQGKSISDEGIDLDYFTICRKGLNGYLSEIIRLRKFLNNSSYDIVHAHYGLAGIVALIARRNEKIVVSFMGDDLLGTNSYGGDITYLSQWLAKINTLLAKRFYNRTIVKSMEMFTLLNNSSSNIIPNGVDIDLFKPNDRLIACNNLGFDFSLKYIIFVSDPTRVEKNYSLARSAVERLSFNNVRLLPVHGIRHVDLVNYYNAACVVVLTSYHEGSPNVIKEAMACNCPIVTTDVGDAKLVIGKTEGCFIAPFKPTEFAEKIMAALEFSQNGQRTKGRDRLIDLGLDSKTIAKKVKNIYKTIE